MKVCGIYKITSPTGKIYIGQTRDVNIRKRHYRTRHCKKQVKLFSSLEKYGFENHSFEVINELPSDIEQSVLDAHEIIYMDAYKSTGVEMMNLKAGGAKGVVCEESRKKISDANKGNKWNVGRKHSDEAKKKMSDSRKGKPTWSKGKKGLVPWNKNKKGVQVAWNKGTKGLVTVSEETKKLLSEQRLGNKRALGHKHTEETKDKITERMRGENHPMFGRKRPDVVERNKRRAA